MIFIVIMSLLSSDGHGSMTRIRLMAVFFRNETGTDLIFFNLIFSCLNSAPLLSKLMFEFST